ncbi:hypothetical protein Pen01_22680 [Phytomonospora endophytica]|nr:hypothetical protein Pen01_22680 [Phytomonospora endophytica]
MLLTREFGVHVEVTADPDEFLGMSGQPGVEATRQRVSLGVRPEWGGHRLCGECRRDSHGVGTFVLD